MKNQLPESIKSGASPLYLLTPDLLQHWLKLMPETVVDWVRSNGFSAKTAQIMKIPVDGCPELTLVGLGQKQTAEDIGALPALLGEGDYFLAFAPAALDRSQMALFWLMGCYRFEDFKDAKSKPACLHIAGANRALVLAKAEAIVLARDLINTPANILGTEALEKAVFDLGAKFGAMVSSIVGNDLLEENYPMIHAVGRAAEQAPRLVHLMWGNESNPAISLVGKGVIFDTGGLNIKTGKFMKLMKKDMGGAANAMALARMIMQAKLPVFLNLFVPIVDNAISGNAYRPSDVLNSRLGLTVEIDNTDAEGRLILADALTRAVEDQPELLIDFATLTGAARVALGPQMAPFYTNDDELANWLQRAAKASADPVWQMPLWDGYDNWLDSDIADICHTSSSPMAGSVTAALFLQRFVAGIPWIHFDIYGWSEKQRPGHPVGGDIQGPLAVFSMLQEKYQCE